VEEQFYIAWALVMRWVKVSCIPWIAAGAIVLSIAARLFNHSDIGVVMCSTVTRLDPLAMGTLVACGAFFPGPMRRPWAWIAAAVAFIVGTEIVLPFYEPAIANAMADYFLVAVACAVILTAVLELRPGKGPIIRALTYLGKLSYGLYVLSPLTLWFLRSWIPDRHFRGYVLRAVLSFTMTIVLAIISYELFEKWFLVIKKRFTYIPSRSA
jgi:peptidoglycan/LPS O-acetylase OafA/YrhL